MAGNNDGGDKTEQPTSKKLADARRKGDVAKSKDVTSTVVLCVWLIVLLSGAGYAGSRIMSLFDAVLASVARGAPFAETAGQIGTAAFLAFVLITALTMVPAAAAGVLSEFLMTGGVFTFDKMNPFEGIKRMFSADNFAELIKTLVKAALVVLVTCLVLRASLGEILDKTGPVLQPTAASNGGAAAAAVLGYTGGIIRTVLLWTLAIFAGVAILDMAWQRRSYIKKLKMSLRDIRQESKENEGDPLIKSNRRQLHEEWANQNAVGATRGAAVLVMNPTHIAVALEYDPDSCPVPRMLAKGEGPLAMAMRAAAEEAGVPIVRYVKVARALYEEATEGEFIPRDMFDAIGQIIAWARRAQTTGERETEMTGER
jgi:type III secretion protein U